MTTISLLVLVALLALVWLEVLSREAVVDDAAILAETDEAIARTEEDDE